MKNLEYALNPILQNLYLRYEDCIVENKLYPTTMEIKIMLKAKNIIPLFSLLFLMQGNAQSDINAGISFGPEGFKSFYLSVSEYYRVPEQQVVVFRERKIPEEELPVVFFVAGITGVNPEVIVNIRLGGSSWYDISIKYEIYPDVYYVPLKSDPGPPYGNAYGYYKNKSRKEWKNIRLTDDDIINLVNLRFISEYYNYEPEKIIKMRGEGKHYVVINENVKVEKKGNKNHDKEKSKGNSNKNK